MDDAKTTAGPSFIKLGTQTLLLIVGVYPLIAAFYLAGFFWNIPTRLIGYFSYADLLLNSSAGFVKIFIFVLTTISIVFALIGPSEKLKQSNIGESLTSLSDPKSRWLLLLFLISTLFYAIAEFIGYSLYKFETPRSVSMIAWTMFIILGLKFFFTKKVSKLGIILVIILQIVGLIMAMGFFERHFKSTEVVITQTKSSENCSLELSGSDFTLVKCGQTFKVWNNSDITIETKLR